MKKLTLFSLALVFLVSIGTYAQRVPPLISQTWRDPNTDASLQSIPSYVTFGLVKDEIDAIAVDPMGLSLFKGWTVFTAYGNYESWNYNPGTAIPPIGFFNPTTLGAGATNSAFKIGMGMPLPNSMRGGFLLGYSYSGTGNLTDTFTANLQKYSSGTTTVNDANQDGVVDNTIAETWTATDSTGTTAINTVLAADLGFMGVNLSLYQNGNGRSIGGKYSYTDTIGPDTTYNPGTDVDTSQSILVGTGKDGAAKGWQAASTTALNIGGQFPLNIGFKLPLVGDIGFSINRGAFPTNMVPITASKTKIYSTDNGAAGAKADTSTMTLVGSGLPASGNWRIDNGGTPVTSFQGATYTRATVDGVLSAKAYVPDKTKNSTTTFDLDVGAEPVFPIGSSPLTIKTRADIGGQFGGGNTTQVYQASGTLDAANPTSTQTHYEVNYSETNPSTTQIFNVMGQLGAIAELANDSRSFVFGLGMMLDPSIKTTNAKGGSHVTTTTYSYTDPTNGAQDATNALVLGASTNPTTAAQTISSTGTLQGSSTLTTTLDTAGTKTSTAALKITIPASFVVKPKPVFSIFAGYYLTATVAGLTTTTTAATTAKTTATVKNKAGTVVYDSTKVSDNPAAKTAQATTTPETVTRQDASTAWMGNMDFGMRLLLGKNATFDLEGTGIMNALNFGIFGGGTGFNPRSFLQALTISLSFRF